MLHRLQYACRLAPARLLAASVQKRVGRGRASLRTLLVVVYLVVLHVAVLTGCARGPTACPPDHTLPGA